METNPNPSHSTLRGAIARLVAAMMVADRRLSTEEIDEAARLDGIGLGPLSPLVQDELQRATRAPIEIDDACVALSGTGPALVGTVLSVLAGVAASDGAIDADESRLFAAVATRLGAGPCDIRDYVASDETPREVESTGSAVPPVPSAAADDVGGEALHAFGLGRTATRAQIDAAYLDVVERYDPVKVAPLGPEFVLLAVQKLAGLSELYEIARDAAHG
jgi:hypothetical protein